MPDHYMDDIYSDINRKKQLEDAQENKEFDRDVEAYRRGQKNLTDEERLERMKDITAKRKQLKDNLLRIINNPESQTLVKSNLRGRALQAQKRRNKRIAEGNTGIAPSEIPGKIIDFGESIAEDPAAMSEQMLDFYTDIQAAGKGAQAGSKFGPVGAGVGAAGAIMLKRIGKEGLENLGRNLIRNIRGKPLVPAIEAVGDSTFLSKTNDIGSQPLMSKGDGYSYRKGRPLKNPIWDNLTPTIQKQFTDAGIDSDKAKFFIETWTREVGATVEGLPFTNRTFEFMQGKLLPEILEDLKGVNLSDGLQLDHIAQLKAMTPFYKGRNLTQAQKIRRILIREGIFGGHNPKNLKYLPTDVHTVKTNFWKQNVGDAGEKFFEGRPMRTYADVEKAAKEMKKFINKSNEVVENLSVQYKLMRGENISNDKLWELLQKVDLNEGQYNLKDVRKLIDEIDVDYAAGNVPTLSKEEFTRTMQKMKRSVDWDELGLADKMRYMEEQTGMTYNQIDEFIKSGWINPEDL